MVGAVAREQLLFGLVLSLFALEVAADDLLGRVELSLDCLEVVAEQDDRAEEGLCLLSTDCHLVVGVRDGLLSEHGQHLAG